MRTFVAALLVLAGAARGQESGAVQGQVVNAATGQPVIGATVVLQGLDTGGTPPDVDSYIAQTGAGGRYRVDDVVPGRYEARPQRAGYTAVPPGASPAKVYVRFKVEPGQCAEVVSRLIPLGSISGRVLDVDGDPVSGVRVEALRYVYNDGKKEMRAAASNGSNDRGDFRVEGLPPGRYYLMTSQQFREMGIATAYLKIRGSKPPINFVPTYYPGVADSARAVPVDVAPGTDVSGIQIPLLAASSYALRAKPMGGQNPSARLQVIIGPASGSGMFFGGDGRYGSFTSYPNTTPGSYVVEARDDSQGLFAREIVEIVNSDVEVTLNLVPEIKLTGTVRVEGGAVPVEKTRIRLVAGQQWFNRAADLNADGTFIMRQLQAVTCRVRVAAPPGSYLKSMQFGDRVLTTPEIDTSRIGGALSITLATDGGTIAGTASEGATVVLVPVGSLREWQDHLRSAVAAKDGKFELRDVAPGDYRLFAWDDADPEATLDPEFRRPFVEQSTPVRVVANERQTVPVKVLSVVELGRAGQ